MSSPNPCHRPVVKERLEKLQLIDRQKAVVHLGSAAMAQSLINVGNCFRFSVFDYFVIVICFCSPEPETPNTNIHCVF